MSKIKNAFHAEIEAMPEGHLPEPIKCKDCQEEFYGDLTYGLCEDCFSEFQANDLEYQLEKAMYLGELRQDSRKP